VEPKRGDYSGLERYLIETLGLDDRPIGFHYTVTPPEGAITVAKKSRVCIYPFLNQVRKGKTAYFSREWKACRGGAFYTGYKKSLMKGVGKFLSTGIPNLMPGEHYKKNPELGEETAALMEYVPAAADHLVFRPLGGFTEDAPPEAAVIFGNADVMGALLFLANYARPGRDNVIVQFSSGCYSLLTEPRVQARRDVPRAVLGSFDITCRPYLDPCTMTFSVPDTMLWEMAAEISGSFLVIDPWMKVRGRGSRGVSR
jgi:uncharacterized protein (DUF169 family)